MNCGNSGRQPQRRPAAAGRAASVLCLILLALALSAGPAAAYPCGGSATPSRTLSAHVTETAAADCSRPRTIHRRADPLSFAFFIGIMLAVVLVPAALLKREDSAPE